MSYRKLHHEMLLYCNYYMLCCQIWLIPTKLLHNSPTRLLIDAWSFISGLANSRKAAAASPLPNTHEKIQKNLNSSTPPSFRIRKKNYDYYYYMKILLEIWQGGKLFVSEGSVPVSLCLKFFLTFPFSVCRIVTIYPQPAFSYYIALYLTC